MLILFSSVIEGGILQLAAKILEIISDNQENVRLFIPDNARVTIDSRLSKYVVRFNKPTRFLSTKKENKITVKKIIEDVKPSIIWYLDNSIISSQISRMLESTNIRQFVTIHDPLSHPTNKKSLKMFIHNLVGTFYKARFQRKCDAIVFLSSESKKRFLEIYPQVHKATYILNLGAHVPPVVACKPISFNAKDYILFFGRIDKYKGLSTFFDIAIAKPELPFVLAGNGELTSGEKNKISNCQNIIFVNRYIPDEEMVYLFENCKCVILPYLEASQSGIIPISYHFGKPVIVSDVKGLSQFVINGETGFVCKSLIDYLEAINCVFSEKYADLSRKSLLYYDSNLDFKKNISDFLNCIKGLDYETTD